MTAAARPQKFMFAQEFGVPNPVRRAEEAEREVARLKAEADAAFERGRAEGLAKGKADREAVELGRIADALQKIAAATQAVLPTLDAERARLEREAIELGVLSGRVLARGLISREPTAEVEHLVGEALTYLRNAPHLVVRVGPDLVDVVRDRLKRLAFERGFEGRLVVIGDPDAGLGDCRIEWADGGIVRDTAAIEADIGAAVGRYLASHGNGTEG